MNIIRIYNEVKALSFPDGYFLCYPIGRKGGLITYTAIVVPPAHESSDFDIIFAGRNIDFEPDNSIDSFSHIVLRLDMPAGNVKRIRFKVNLPTHYTEQIVCKHKITCKEIGCSYYLPPNLYQQDGVTEVKHMLRAFRSDNELSYLLSGFDDCEKLKNIINGVINTRLSDKDIGSDWTAGNVGRDKHREMYGVDISPGNIKGLYNSGFLPDNFKLLDWGVGSGRVASHMRRDKHFEMYGADIDPVNMNALHNSGFPPSNFKLMKPDGEIPFKDGTFDAVYGISVFTHLTEDLQFKYLKELSRVLKPDGVGVFSVHGFVHFFSRINDGAIFYKWMEKGFLVTGDNYDLRENFAESNTGRLYVDTLHTPNYIYENWLRVFSKIQIIRAPNSYGQDLVVCQK